MGILQARILEWVPFPPPGDLPDPETKPPSLRPPALAGGFFTSGGTGKPFISSVKLLKGEHACVCEIGRLLTY